MKKLVALLLAATLLTASPAYASEERIAELEEKVEDLESRLSDIEEIFTLFLSDSDIFETGDPEEIEEETEAYFDDDEEDEYEDEEDSEEPVFYLSNPSGSTENGDEIIIYRNPDRDEEYLNIQVWNYNGTLLTYIYADGSLVEKDQLKYASFSIDLTGSAIEPGTHTVELRQYEDNDTDTEPIFVQSAEYTVK